MSRLNRGSLSVEFVVVDNGSVDGTQQVLDEFRAKLPLTSLREPAPGKSRALNRALREVTLGSLIVFTDDDVTPNPAWLTEIVAASQRWPNHSVFGGRIEPEWPGELPPPGWAHDGWIRQVAFAAHHLRSQEAEYPVNCEPFGPNFWVRRAVLSQGVEFPEHIGPHPTRRTLCDETHFLRQLRQRGLAPVYVPTAQVRHRIEMERLTKLAVCRRAMQLGRGRFYLDWVPGKGSGKQPEGFQRWRIARDACKASSVLLQSVVRRGGEQAFAEFVKQLSVLSAHIEALRVAGARAP
jgi:GT2 family glycosyltransferase